MYFALLFHHNHEQNGPNDLIISTVKLLQLPFQVNPTTMSANMLLFI